ncbi:MAG: AMP-binding protein [Planctomycetia bacterium]|nr:AMP-binding protein [Planctomycetia bacterium]
MRTEYCHPSDTEPFYRQFCEEELDETGELKRFDLRFSENYNFGYDVVDRIADHDPEKKALVWLGADGEEKIFTFGDIRRLSNQAANAFLAHGIKKGDRVMLILKRSYEYWYAVVALHKIGAVAVPASHMLTLEDLVYRIRKVGISAVIALHDESLHRLLHLAQSECTTLKQIWTIGSNSYRFCNFTKEIEGRSDSLERIPTKANDIMIVYFTSGTTGYPKAVAHNHLYTLAHIITARYWQRVVDGGLHLTVADTGWGKASWGKIYGQWILGSAVLVYDFESFDSRSLVNVMNRYEVTTFCAPPTVYRYMVKRDNINLPHLKHATSAGEYLPPEISRQFEKQTGITVAEGYGQTETTLLIANLAGSKTRRGSMGKASPLYDIQVVKEDGSLSETGEPGEIILVSKKNQRGLMLGYLSGKKIDASSIRDGIHHTGDSGWKDKDGYFWYNGRVDDVIKTGGFRVGPVEIENIVIEHPQVLECSVVGVPDPLRGQAIKALIVLVADTEPCDELKNDIRTFANNRLAVFKHIRIVDFVDELPKTSNGKIRKRTL